MLERYDSTELLALIEGELDHASASAMQARLAKDPQAAGRVAAMMRDRVSLREIEDPALPHDFIATIEPMLSRPMLIEPAAEVMAAVPGEFRRQHRRRTSPRRWVRLAVAAGLMLAAMGGAWAAFENWESWTGRDADGERLARNSEPSRDGERQQTGKPQPAPGVIAASPASSLGPGAIHHDLRPRSIANARQVAASGTRERDPASASEPSIVVADFAIVVAAIDSSVAEERFSGALSSLGSTGAFVRNFNYGEAQVLAEEYRLAHAGPVRDNMKTGDERSVASSTSVIAPGSANISDSSLSRLEMQQLAQRVRDQLRSKQGSRSASSSSGNLVITGAQALSPTLEQQLEFSSRGATHTIAVPASQLVALIERLALDDAMGASAGFATTLRMLPTRSAEAAADGEEDDSSALAWLTDGPLVRQAMQRLSQARGDAIVFLPVIVK